MSKMELGDEAAERRHDVQVRAINPDNHRELEQLADLFGSPDLSSHGQSIPAEYLQKLFWISLLAPSSVEKLYTGLLGTWGSKTVAHLGIEFIPSYGTLSLHHFVSLDSTPYDALRSVVERMREIVAEQASRLGIKSCLLFSRVGGSRTGRLIEEIFSGVHVATLPSGRDDGDVEGRSSSTDVYLVPLPQTEHPTEQAAGDTLVDAIPADATASLEHAAPERRTIFPPLNHLPLIHAIYKRLPLIRDIDSSAAVKSEPRSEGRSKRKSGTRASYTQGHCRTGFLRHLGLHYVFLDPSARSIDEHLQLCFELATSSRLARRRCLALIPITKPGNDNLVASLEEQGWQVVGVLPLFFGEDLIALSQQTSAIIERGVEGKHPKAMRGTQALRQTPLPM